MATDPQTTSTPTGGHRRPARLRIFTILLISFLVLIAATAISAGFAVHRYWQGILRDEIQRDLTQKARLVANRINTERGRNIEDLASQEGQQAGARATVVDMNGKVIADSEVPIAALENEGKSPEFQTALRGETGIESRKSSVFGIPVLYVAVPVSGGAVRLSYPLGDINAAAARGRHILELGCTAAVLAALVISTVAAEMITRRLRAP
ncbi:MAG TPA: hypothetical protein VFB00_09105 [Terriglobales bacterium]|nr:hypothetical protein [Terriglobales bacterium]